MSTNSPVQNLAAAMRAAGLHRLDRRDIELRLGRTLTRQERRALAIAADSTSLKNGAKAAHAGRQAAIRQAGQIKGARLPRPQISADGGLVDVSRPRAGERTNRSGPIADRTAEYSHSPGKRLTVAQADLVRKAIRQPNPRVGTDSRTGEAINGKPEQWDRKR